MKGTIQTLLLATAVMAGGSLAVAQEPQPSQPPESTQSSQPSPQGRDEAGARQHLVAAKQALMDLTKLPEASQLQGEARNGVIQIINSFNSLVTAEANWYERYQEVQGQLARVLGGDATAGSTAPSGAEAGSTGTSGGATASMPEPVRSKLIEFRQHLDAFGAAAGAPANAAAAGTGSSAGSSAAGSTSGSVSGQSTTSGSAGSTTGSSSTTTQSGSTTPQSGSTQAGTMTSASGETFQQHFDAIADLVQQALGASPSSSSSATSGTGSTTSSTSGTSGSTTGSTSGAGTTGSGTTGSTTGAQTGTSGATSVGAVTVDRATLEQIQSHIQRLRELARQRGIQ